MDSLSQFVLGAAVGTALLGPRIGARKACLVGGVLGTLPDLDVFYPFDDPVDAFVLHRAATHSLIVHAAAAPLVGEGLVRLFKGLRDARLRTCLAVFLIFATHALLDAMTVYGTQLFWPIWREPLGLGSMFIIDPLYTVPLLVAAIWALCVGGWGPRIRRATAIGLAVSTAYLGWSAAAQQMVLTRAADRFAAAGIRPERTIALAAPFTTWLWRVVAVDGDRYAHVYLRAVGSADDAPLYVFPRHLDALACAADSERVRTLDRFTDGFWTAGTDPDGAVMLSDLRMGLPPNYVFRFAVADAAGRPIPPERRRVERSTPGDTDWLLAMLVGDDPVRPAEAQYRLTDDLQVVAASSPPMLRNC